MTARDRWDVEFRCPTCGKEGIAEVSQADGWAFIRDQSTDVDSITEGFRYRMVEGRPKFYCVKDDVPTVPR